MKKILGTILALTGTLFYAQTIGNSPYAAFGIGDVKYDNTIETGAMGGISTAYISDFTNSYNFKNPAANTNLELSTIKVELTNENNFLKSNYNNISATKHSNYISNIVIAFPISKKVKFGMGYQPYSSKRYSISNSTTDNNGIITANLFRGEGTLSTVQAGLSYQVAPEFALGFRTNFYFGNLYDIDELTQSNAILINGYETRNKIKTFNFTLGTTYQKKLEKDRKLTLGATYSFGNTGKMETFYTNSTYYYNTANGEKDNINIIDEKYSNDKQLIPMEFSLGAGYGNELKWFIGAQYDFKKGETIQFLGQPFSYQNSSRISAGGWIIPNLNNFRNYFSQVIYRYGAYYQKGNLNINGTNINQYGLTLGATFPFQNRSSSRLSGIDFGIELGKRGTLQNNLINQNFINFKFGINFSDRWFGKKLYN